ncbi:hypothetical protein KIKIMORA_00230 [Brevundimonas phage vB_BpoS-Kikimora]|uniref:Uncharacterized protein n=1 Tax=Brevundimonas phage vB_BpoS-Kikimora TaxID=2948601 RepID=A0A9E7MS97_9CAUD|nr:hypothetical protein KIKIMORA_00230 [Brevundimonas phage vB_BpoS-Kikimora]
MSSVFSGRIRPHGSSGMSIDRSGARCEIGLGNLTIDLSDEQARMLRRGLVALYGLPAEFQFARREAAKPPRRMPIEALPPEALEVLKVVTDEWTAVEILCVRADLPRPDAAVRALLSQLANARLIERRKIPTSARRAPVAHYRLAPAD